MTMFKALSTKAVFTSLLLTFSSLSFAKTIEHTLGSIEIKEQPQRIVVLSHGALDFLDEIGVEPVGVVKQLLPSHLEQYGDKKYQALGSLKEPNFEEIFMAKPDLIIAEGRQAELYKDLSAIAPVYMYQIDNSDYWKTTQHHWRVLGDLFGQTEQVEGMITKIEEQFRAIESETKANSMNAMSVMNAGNRLSMFGTNSRFSVIYDELGFETRESKNVESVARPHGNLISFEYVADAQPDVIFILDRQQAIGQGNANSAQFFDNPLVNSTPAAKTNKVVFLDSAAWYLTAGGYTSTQIMINDVKQVL
ncbi:siderophore ABC transporter substrate-binding protein [Vibrio astriarenae]|uniref:siderophore ABC transporter substrate-binding protein n=1 Tax=Vibrio astriarenae TaxID=1481923 RepID=UPI001EF9306E|nr:siderophore ABC transporter substrate-binding protein [Vibrio astriarenae]